MADNITEITIVEPDVVTVAEITVPDETSVTVAETQESYTVNIVDGNVTIAPKLLQELLDVVFTTNPNINDVLFYTGSHWTSSNIANVAFSVSKFSITQANTARNTANAAFDKANSANVLISDIAPISALPGDLWWNSTYAKLFVYYSDNNSSQWVEISGGISPGSITDYSPAFNQANAAFSQANNVFDQANNLFAIVFDQANAAYNKANVEIDFPTANDAYTQANAAYAQANTLGIGAFVKVNTAYVQANIARTQANTARNQANAAYTQANAAYTYANTIGINANNWANTIGINANNWANLVGLAANSYADSLAFNVSGALGPLIANVYNQANTSRDLANTSYDQSNAAFEQANAAYTQANTIGGAAFDQANSAYLQANNAIANTNNVTIYGDLHVTGTLNVGLATTTITTDNIIVGNVTVAGFDLVPRLNQVYDTANISFTSGNAVYDYANTIGGSANDWANSAISSNINAFGLYANSRFLANSDGVVLDGWLGIGNTALGYEWDDRVVGITIGGTNNKSGVINFYGEDGLYIAEIFTTNTNFGHLMAFNVFDPDNKSVGNITFTEEYSRIVSNTNFYISSNYNGGVDFGTHIKLYRNYDNNSRIEFMTSDIIRMMLSNTGNLGIGITNPNYKLDIVGAANASQYYINGTLATDIANSYSSAAAIAANTYANSTFLKLTSATGQILTSDLTIVGNLSFSGNTTFSNVTTLSITDPLIYLAANNDSSDIVDIGFIGHYVNTTGANVHTGLYREHTDKMYYLFQGYDKDVVNNHVGALSNNMTLAVLNADLITSNLTLGGVNAITWITNAYDKANAANLLAFNTGIGANAYASAVGAAANSYASSVGIAANTFANGKFLANTTGTFQGDLTVTGLLTVSASSGDEGGEIRLANAVTNSLLAGPVNIDVWQNKLRFFVAGGDARGAFINLDSTSASVGTNLLAGTDLTPANNWANQIGQICNAYAASLSQTGDLTPANNWANTIGIYANNWANTIGINANNWANTIGINANNWANTIGSRSNSYASAAAVAANAYASAAAVAANVATGAGANAYASAAAVAANVATGAGANAYARTVGTAGNTYASAAAVAANVWANTIGVNANNWANTVGIYANNWANTIGIYANNYTNTAITANVSALGSFANSKFVANTPQSVLLGGATHYGIGNTPHYDPSYTNQTTITLGGRNNTGGIIYYNKNNLACMMSGYDTKGFTQYFYNRNYVGNYDEQVGEISAFGIPGYPELLIASYNWFKAGAFIGDGQGTSIEYFANTSGTATSNGRMIFNVEDAGGIAFNERMRIDYKGNVLIGRTDSIVGQSTLVDVAGAVNASAFLVNGVPLTSGGTTDLTPANNWANTVAIYANNWANTVVINANTWANTIGARSNAYTNTALITANTWANTIGIYANNWANSVGQAANTYASSAAVAANAYSASIANTIAIAAFGKANSANVLGANAAVEFIIDGAGSAITLGQKGHLEIPFNATIAQWTILGDQSGSCNVEIWKAPYVAFPPVAGNTINATGFTLTSATKGQGTAITTTTISAGDILAYNVVTLSTFTRLTVSLKVVKT